MVAMVKREVKAFLLAPSGWVVLALFAFGSSLVFLMGVFQSGRPASLRFVLEFDAIFLMLAAPAVTMAAIGEERRRGTWELLCASPMPTWTIVLAKFSGAAIIGLCMLLIPTVVQIALLEAFGRPDLGEVVCGLLGVYLLGLTVMASGLLASALTGGASTAFLITALSWVLAIVVLEMALPAVLPPQWAPLVAGIDPVQRLQAFTLGLFDSANVIYFVALSIFFLTAATVLSVPGRRRVDVAGICGVLLLVVAFIVLAGTEPMQWRVDATKSRRYSLSPRTTALLEDLQGEWRIAVLLVEDRADPALLRQVDEVLGRYAQGAEALQVERIDPTDPTSVLAFEALLQALRHRLSDETTQWDAALDQGEDALGDLVLFAQTSSAALRDTAQGLEDPALQEALRVRAAAMALLGAEGSRLIDSVSTARAASAGHPLADRGLALAILQQVLGQWSEELDAIGRLLKVVDDPQQAERWRARGHDLARTVDVLRRLPPSELAAMGDLLAQGEAAVVIGPNGAAVIPAAQLLPSAMGEAIGGVAVDQRFRGDQVLAAAIRSLVDGITPRVVFVHAEETSLLDGKAGAADLSGSAAMLRASRIEVQQWQPASRQQPEPWTAGPTAWVVVPPVRSGGLKPTEQEQALLAGVAQLLGRGESVMINLNPSLAPRYGQRDPWATLLRPWGIEADTGLVVLQALPAADGDTALSTMVRLADFPAPHPIAAALHGQDLALPLPTPVQAIDGFDVVELGVRAPDEGIWLEPDWRMLTMGGTVPQHRLPRYEADLAPKRGIPLIAAVERDAPGAPQQRLLVVGSGAWLRTNVADRAVPAGGSRIALAHPGNHELLLAGTAWLSGLDDRIAAGPLSQEVARLGAIGRGARAFWAWIMLLGLPALLGAAGATIAFRRRDA
jgi:ABC-2 type transport system permease protein